MKKGHTGKEVGKKQIMVLKITPESIFLAVLSFIFKLCDADGQEQIMAITGGKEMRVLHNILQNALM